MARTGRPKPPLVLTDEERLMLDRLAKRRQSAQAIAVRARIVLACATCATNQAVAAEVGVTANTVTKWRNRFVERRLKAWLMSTGPRRHALSSMTGSRP